MIANLYNYTGYPNLLDKTGKLTNPTTIELQMPIDFNPNGFSVAVSIDSYEQCKYCNYVYIPTLQRYYYIKNITIRGQLVTIHLQCDVLMTFHELILQSKATLTYKQDPTSNENFAAITSTNFVKESKKTVKKYDLESDLFDENGTIVAITVKGDAKVNI